MTDDFGAYKKLGKAFASHEVVNHSAKEYARGDVTTNTVESSFALLKRGLIGTFHSVSEQHLQRYATEFDFRWNTRQSLGFNDTQRAAVALKNIGGKRLTYRRIDA
jgi:ISXO2-like transposase domain